MTHTTTSSAIRVLRPVPAYEPPPVGSAPDPEPVIAPRRGRALRTVGAVLVAALAVVGTTAWIVAHRAHRPMPAAVAQPAAEAWCAYNFPPPHDSTADSPNLNSSACRLGFLDGATNPNTDSTPERMRIAATASQVGATNPQGMWDIAYLAGWAAGHDAARSA
jgi:hypothetical protein